MKCISAWFDRHPKTRIALQLVLDGLPFLLVILLLYFGFSMKIMDGWSGTYIIEPSRICKAILFGLLVLSIPAFIASFLWRDRAFELFEQHRWCRYISNMLRILGALIVSIVFVVDIAFVALWVSL